MKEWARELWKQRRMREASDKRTNDEMKYSLTKWKIRQIRIDEEITRRQEAMRLTWK